MHRDQAGRGPEFIHHNGHVALALAKFIQQVGEHLGLGHHQHIAHELADLQLWLAVAPSPQRAQMQAAKQIPRIQNSHDVLAALLGVVNRDPRVVLVQNSAGSLVERKIGGQRKNIRTRHHHLAHRHIAQVEGVMNDVFLQFGQHAYAAAAGDHQLQLLG